jgi:hypothetical protein
MAKIDSVLLEIEQYTQNANDVKDLVLNRLMTDKVITEDDAKTYSEKWQIIVVKESWFKRWASVFSKRNTTYYMFKFVKFED